MSFPISGDVETHFQRRTDYANATTVYYGVATPGAVTADASWRIAKQTLDSQGRETLLQFANKTHHFTQVWDNRATLTYG